MNTWSELIRVELASGDPAEVIAKRVASSVSVSTKAQWLIELLTAEVEHEKRTEARDIEAKAFAEVFIQNRPLAPIAAAGRASGPFAKLYDSPFAIGDSLTVTWGKATVAQHTARIIMLEKLREGLQDTIERHREAIRVIQAAGVSCLEDVV